MSDLIRREDAIEILSERAESLRGMQGDLGGACRGAMRIIESLPSAEPERKKGKWSNYKDEHCCSVCHSVVISDCWDDEIRYDYCPYCSAEMEWE